MDSFELVPDVWRIYGGIGENGENFGGIFINSTPGILIGASGTKTFLRNFKQLQADLGFSSKFQLLLPNVTAHEIYTLDEMVEVYQNMIIRVHKDQYQAMLKPRVNYFEDRFLNSQLDEAESVAKKFPKSFDNVQPMDKLTSIETDKTKILVIPFPGPHAGHSFIYSRDHKLLCSGLVLGQTASNPNQYYLDMTGSLDEYHRALDFLDQARSEIVVPAYDEPRFISTSGINTSTIRDSIEMDNKSILEICESWISFKDIVKSFKNLRYSFVQTKPYDDLDMTLTVVRKHLYKLLKEGKLVKQDKKYKRA
ncbi:MAG: MBL fold metallo-hydrolase [Candidatus Heimdallarchaeota archaeon]|nr:MBL fold metallo-hydrolase [Candidatus Heimdallarchaeota archaeon]